MKKKVDSLIETCTLITNRAEPEYAGVLKVKLSGLNDRWSGIITSTEKQKENLRNAGVKFQEIDAGVREITNYLKGLETILQNENLLKLVRDALQNKEERYQVWLNDFVALFLILFKIVCLVCQESKNVHDGVETHSNLHDGVLLSRNFFLIDSPTLRIWMCI